MENLTLKQIAEILGINASNSINIEGLDYFYYNEKEADEACIVVYYKKQQHRYSYFTAEEFMGDHGLENANELNQFIK